MWETIQSLDVESISYTDRLLFKQKDALMLYDLQGRKCLDQFNKPVTKVIGTYFVSNDILYNGESLNNPVVVLSCKIEHIVKYQKYWIIGHGKLLSLYSDNGELLHQLKCKKINKIISGTVPILLAKSLSFIEVKMNKLQVTECNFEGTPFDGSNHTVLSKVDGNSVIVYFKNAKSLQLPLFSQWSMYEQYLFIVQNSEIVIYDCAFGVIVKSVLLENEINTFAYNGQFIIASTASSVMFTPVQLNSSAQDIFSLNMAPLTVDCSFGLVEVDAMIETPDILTCPDYQVPQLLAELSDAALMDIFKSLRESGPTMRVLLIIKLLNKQNHNILKDYKSQLLQYLTQESLKCEQAGILRSRIKALKTLPKIVPAYSIETVYF